MVYVEAGAGKGDAEAGGARAIAWGLGIPRFLECTGVFVRGRIIAAGWLAHRTTVAVYGCGGGVVGFCGDCDCGS